MSRFQPAHSDSMRGDGPFGNSRGWVFDLPAAKSSFKKVEHSSAIWDFITLLHSEKRTINSYCKPRVLILVQSLTPIRWTSQQIIKWRPFISKTRHKLFFVQTMGICCGICCDYIVFSRVIGATLLEWNLMEQNIPGNLLLGSLVIKPNSAKLSKQYFGSKIIIECTHNVGMPGCRGKLNG